MAVFTAAAVSQIIIAFAGFPEAVLLSGPAFAVAVMEDPRMRISVKGRYALAAVIEMAKNKSRENIAAVNIANQLGISKIYLEQVFTQLKKNGILSAVKGSRGGYQLARSPVSVTAWDILSSLETALVEVAEPTVAENAPSIEIAMKEAVFTPLDEIIRTFLSGITVQSLLDMTEKQQTEQSFMLNI
jgi:Rrf2 family protein